METQQLLEEINALPEPARRTIEQLVLLLRQQPAARKMPPVLRASTPLTEADQAAEKIEKGGWETRSDISSGAEYIHEVRRGLRKL